MSWASAQHKGVLQLTRLPATPGLPYKARSWRTAFQKCSLKRESWYDRETEQNGDHSSFRAKVP